MIIVALILLRYRNKNNGKNKQHKNIS